MSQLTMGEIEGEKVDRGEFENIYSVLYGSTADPSGARNALWNYMVEEAIVRKEADKMGLGVSKAELMELQFGVNPSPIIAARFSDPNNPGMINREQLNNIKQIIEGGTVKTAIEQGQLGASFIPYWRHQEKEIIKDRLQSKINAVVSKGMYTPTWMSEMGFKEQNESVDFLYVKVPYDEIDNTEVSLSDDDFKTFLKDNKARFTTKEEKRKLDYVIFSVLPTKEDSATAMKRVADQTEAFAAAENDSIFVLGYNGIISDTYAPREELSELVADTLLSIPVGTVYGPYMDAGAYRVAKVRARQMIADSADTRHILISAESPMAFPRAKKTLDSLENLLAQGASFDTLALKFSTDPGSSNNGGKYENVLPNQFVPEFNEVLFVTGEIGKRYMVKTSYGWHLVEVLKRSSTRTARVKVAYLNEPIVPSKETEGAMYEKATGYVTSHRKIEDLVAAASKDKSLLVETSSALNANDGAVGTLGSADDAREMVRWAFRADKGQVSPTVYTFKDNVNYFDSRYVVAGLRSVQKAGLPAVEDVRAEIETEVINLKKGELIKSRITGSDLSAIATQFKTVVDTATNVTFNAPFVPNVGNEPKVIATATKLGEGTTSAPVVGQTGVFVLRVTKKQAAPAADPASLKQTAQRISTQARSSVTARLIEAMKKDADIEDNRATFY